MNRRLLISGGHIVDPSQGWDRVGQLLLVEGKVAWLGEGESPLEPEAVLPAKGLVVAPGFVDLHCHLREPGHEDKETIATGSRAAAQGGFTAVCAMANTSPPADTAAVIGLVLKKAREEDSVRVFPVGCLTRGRQGEGLANMAELASAGAIAFSDDGSPVADPRLFRHALEYSLSLGLLVMEHAEDLALARGGVMNEGALCLRLGLRGIPAQAEEVAVARDIALAALTGARLHLCHLSTAGAVELVRRAKERGIAITAEVTPHHLLLGEELVLGRGDRRNAALGLQAYDTNARVNPPLRTPRDREALLQGLREGVIDAIATDHAPHTLVDKQVEFDQAAPGISGLETALSLLLSLVHSGALDLPRLISRLTRDPARIIGQGLGSLRPGSPADVVVFDPHREWVVTPEALASKGKNTPLLGERLKGRVMATLVAGRFAYLDSALRLAYREPQPIGGEVK